MASMINPAVEGIFSSHLPAIIRACKFPSYPPPTRAGGKRKRILLQDPMSDSYSENGSLPPTKKNLGPGGGLPMLSHWPILKPMMIWSLPPQLLPRKLNSQ